MIDWFEYSWSKDAGEFEASGRFPRKKKLSALGRIISKKKIRRMISEILITPSKYCWSFPESNIPLFCPRCGCENAIEGLNRTCYPEIWKYWYCSRCKHVVATADNSPITHVLETGEYEIGRKKKNRSIRK